MVGPLALSGMAGLNAPACTALRAVPDPASAGAPRLGTEVPHPRRRDILGRMYYMHAGKNEEVDLPVPVLVYRPTSPIVALCASQPSLFLL